MRKNIARKCLCIALASAMMLGEAGTAMAASVENAADGRTAATVAAEEQADVAAANVSIWYAGAYKNSRTITINASGQAYRVEVWVNGVKCGEQYNSPLVLTVRSRRCLIPPTTQRSEPTIQMER